MKRILSGIKKSGLIFLLVLGGRTCLAQVTLTANSGGSVTTAKNYAIVFAIENTNSQPVTITEMGIQRRNTSPVAGFNLWYYNGTGSQLTGSSPDITTASGWTQSVSVTNIPAPGATGIQTIFTNLNITIPANTMYRFAIQGQGSGAGVNTFYIGNASGNGDTAITAGGVTLWTGSNSLSPGLVGTLPAPSAQSRGFSGSITFTSGGGSGCIAPSIPVVTATTNTICTGGNTTLSIASGNLHDATSWHWYAGSCGGTPVGTGTSVNVSPSANTTYYVRGEGGCVTPGSCASSMIEVTGTAVPSVTVTPMPGHTVCDGDLVTFSAFPVSGGPSPAFQWKKNGINVGANSPVYTDNNLASGNEITCVLTSSLSCANPGTAVSSPVTMTVHPLPAVPVITVSNATLTSSATDGNQWYVGNNAINGATGQSHTAMETGWYKVQVTEAATGCSIMSDSVYVEGDPGNVRMLTGNTPVQVYPNPFTDRLTIEAKGEMRITDQLGRIVHRQVLTGGKTVLDLGNLLPGVYFLQVSTGAVRETLGIVKYGR